MVQLKMDITKKDNNVPASIAGDDGEAMSKIEEDEVYMAGNEPKMPDDAGWYVAVVRCKCEKRIADTIKANFEEKNTWFEYWVPMQRIVYIDKRSNKRRVKEKVLLTTVMRMLMMVFQFSFFMIADFEV